MRPLFRLKNTALAALFLLICSGSGHSAKASLSDSLDVHHYTIRIDTIHTSGFSIRASCDITLTPKVSALNTFTFDLLSLVIDSAKVNGVTATWTYNDTLLRVNSAASFNPSDTVTVSVWYNGQPKKDPSTFGGFYFASGYVYNIGVAFVSDPHPFGRVWFPCKDNFTDRSTYDIYIREVNTKKAVCGGELIASTDNGDGTTTWHWKLRESIPTYLASMAVSNYQILRDTFVSITGDTIPVQIWGVATDTNNIKTQFAKLETCWNGFEDRLGPYLWERVGYVMVPFSGGAMEHAANIAYPRAVLGSGLAYEYLWAHELSHHWFGNLVTCEDAPEMWLNEGFAAYCEALFMEIAYDSTTYKNYVRNNHADVLRATHKSDGGFLAVSGVDHDHTYGSTVYDKGAAMVHTLRKYMGDSAFFDAIRYYLDTRKFASANTDSLEASLEMASGQDLTAWMDGWIQTPGFAHFSIDSFSAVPSGPNWDVTVHIRQRMRGRTALTADNRVTVTFMNSAWQRSTQLMTFSSATASQTFTVPFQPDFVMADFYERNCDATIDLSKTIKTTGTHSMALTFVDMNVLSVTDSAFVRITNNYVAPDSFITPGAPYRLSNSRYTTVEGTFPPGFHARGIFSYNGKPGSCASCNIDETWFATGSEDSLVLFYRKGAGYEWELVTAGTLNTGPLTDRAGNFTVDTLKSGEYTFGIRDALVSIEEAMELEGKLKFSFAPNPTAGIFTIMLKKPDSFTLRVIDMSGRSVWTEDYPEKVSLTEADLSALDSGTYIAVLTNSRGQSGTRKLVIQK